MRKEPTRRSVFSLDDFGLSDSEFFLKVIRACRDGSVVFLDQCEPETWEERLRPWGRPKAAGEWADRYVLDSASKAVLESLVRSDLEGFRDCHHVDVIGPEDELLMIAHDNFEVIELDRAFAAMLMRDR